MNFVDFGDSAPQCFRSQLWLGSALAKQLSALSPKFTKFIPAALLLASTALAHAESIKVAASFKPVHSLVASVMQGIGEPYLIVKGAASPHDYAMTPAGAEALQEADAAFWIGPELETFLAKPLAALGGRAEIVTLDEAEGLIRLPLRGSGAALDTFDPHIWLDPQNARIMVGEIEKALSAKDPANAAAYKANAARTITALDALDAELAALLAPVKGKPFITFHDAFQYFEKRFGIEASGSITVNPDAYPGAARIVELRAKVKELGATCVFAEPNFEPKIIDAVIEGSSAKVGALDPEASTLMEGPELYFQSMREIAASMKACLGT
jgi:zinc transport system substrate-binding protein